MTKPPALRASSHTKRLEPQDLRPHLPEAPGEVIVIAAPPGSGKSKVMYDVITQRVADSGRSFPGSLARPYRVLWAVHGLYKDESLGHEALKELNGRMFMMPYGARLLHGQDRMPSRKAYYAQFTWPDNVAIHVVSHAHLPFLLSPSPPDHVTDFMQQVDLIVVDEDPLESLVYTSAQATRKLWCQTLRDRITSGAGGDIEQALLTLMEQALGGTFSKGDLIQVTSLIDEEVTVSLTGRAFWKKLLPLLGTPLNFTAFRETLMSSLVNQKEGLATAKLIISTFERDWMDACSGKLTSHRFGLTWEEGKPDSMQFRCDLLRPIRGDSPPMVILDAYAEPDTQEYQRMFPQHHPKFVQVQEPVPLDVEVVPAWMVDRLNLVQKRQPQRRNHVLSELGKLATSHQAGLVVLSYKKVTKFMAQPAFIPHLKLHSPNLHAKSVAWAHWYAGRGVNKFSGRHVVALHPPERPILFEHHLLAALAPHEPNLRKEIARHMRDTELLQMLHRGRQTTYAPTDHRRPRVLVAFELPVTDTRWVTTGKTIPSGDFRSHTSNPHHRVAVAVLGAELRAVLGAVPHISLVSLGLYDPAGKETRYVKKATSALRQKTRSVKRSARHLHTWNGADHSTLPLLTLSPFRPVDGTHQARVLEDLHFAPGLTDLKKFSVSVNTAWGGGTTRVYAVTQDDADEAIRKLGGLP